MKAGVIQGEVRGEKKTKESGFISMRDSYSIVGTEVVRDTFDQRTERPSGGKRRDVITLPWMNGGSAST